MTAAVIHPPHRHRAHHVLHPQPYPGIHRRDLGLHALPWRQSAAGVARAVDRLGEQRIGVLVLRLDDDVVGFAHRNAALVARHRLDVLTVGGTHRHLETRNAYTQNGGTRAVAEPTPEHSHG